MTGMQMTTAMVIFVFCVLNALKEVGQMIQQVSTFSLSSHAHEEFVANQKKMEIL